MMIDLVFDYMAAKGVVFYSQEEMKTAEAGIREYLQCNGIPEEKNDEYYRDYLHRGLDIIDPADLKAYFLHRKAISLVVQLRIEQAHAGGVLKPERAVLLREALAELYRAGPASQGVSSDGRGTRVPGVGRGRSCPAAADHPAATAPGTGYPVFLHPAQRAEI